MNKIFYYLSLMKFDDELRWGLELSLFELKDLENEYRYRIRISKEEFHKLERKFYECE